MGKPPLPSSSTHKARACQHASLPTPFKKPRRACIRLNSRKELKSNAMTTPATATAEPTAVESPAGAPIEIDPPEPGQISPEPSRRTGIADLIWRHKVSPP